MAEHGLKLSTTTEYKVEQALPALAATPPRGAELWLYLQETLVQPHAADALRAMNALRLLALLLPELKGIEALVVRDFYHRYTVDEHSFLAIENLHRLKESKSEWDQRFAELLGELEQPELLYLACCCTIPAKAVPGDNHVELSLQLTDSCAERLDLDAGGSRDGALSGGQPSRNVGGDAARCLRSGKCEVVRGKSGRARAAQNAVPDDLCRHQSRESRRP